MLSLFYKESVPIESVIAPNTILVKKSYIDDERVFFITSSTVNVSIPANTPAGVKQVHSVIVNLIDRGAHLKFLNTSFREISSEAVSEFTAQLLEKTIEKITGCKIDSDTLGAALCSIKEDKQNDRRKDIS